MSSKKHSAMEQWFQKNCSWAIPRSRRVSSTSQHSDAPDAQARPTTIPTNVPSTSTVSRHLPLSPAQGTSHEAFVKPSIIVNQPVTAPELPGSSIGKQIQLPRVYRYPSIRFTDHNPPQGNPTFQRSMYGSWLSIQYLNLPSKFLPPQALQVHFEVENAFHPMVLQLEQITLEPVSRSVSWFFF